MKTSIHIEPCKILSSRCHNLRQKEMPHINYSLTELNENQIFINENLSSYLKKIKEDYKNYHKRKLTKQATPIREGVVVCSEDTDINELIKLSDKIKEEFNIQILEIHLHKDEGHINNEGDFIINYHAHMVFDWYDWNAHKTIKLNREDMANFQTIVAENLKMERGKSSSVKHLNSITYKIKQEKNKLDLINYTINFKKENLTKIEEEIKNTSPEDVKLYQDFANEQVISRVKFAKKCKKYFPNITKDQIKMLLNGDTLTDENDNKYNCYKYELLKNGKNIELKNSVKMKF